MSGLQESTLEKSPSEIKRAWQEFGQPLAGSTVGNPPQAPRLNVANANKNTSYAGGESIKDERTRVA